LPYIDRIDNHIKSFSLKQKSVETVISCHTLIQHISDNIDLGLKYLLNEITEKDWIFCLKKRQKKMEKDTEIHQMLDMFSQVSTDIINRMMYMTTKSGLIDLLKSLLQIKAYVNEHLAKINDRFNNQVPLIGSTWEMTKRKSKINQV